MGLAQRPSSDSLAALGFEHLTVPTVGQCLNPLSQPYPYGQGQGIGFCGKGKGRAWSGHFGLGVKKGLGRVSALGSAGKEGVEHGEGVEVCG